MVLAPFGVKKNPFAVKSPFAVKNPFAAKKPFAVSVVLPMPSPTTRPWTAASGASDEVAVENMVLKMLVSELMGCLGEQGEQGGLSDRLLSKIHDLQLEVMQLDKWLVDKLVSDIDALQLQVNERDKALELLRKELQDRQLAVMTLDNAWETAREEHQPAWHKAIDAEHKWGEVMHEQMKSKVARLLHRRLPS